MKNTPVSVPEPEVQKVTINRKFKDELFRMIFQNKEDLLELYNAVNDSDYKDPEELTITTLEDVIFLGMKNDLSFLIDSELNLYEHQSTWNENMPLRGLFYFAEMLRSYVEQNDLNLYREKRIPLPLPKYIVFYNGTKANFEREELCLSASYPEAVREQASLECKVTILNINKGHNPVIMSKSKRLSDYAYFVQAVRDNIKQEYQIRDAVVRAVDECISEGILVDVLRKNRAEVLDLFMTTYDAKLHKKAIEEDAREIGMELGLAEGRAIGLAEGRAEGKAEGKAEEREHSCRILAESYCEMECSKECAVKKLMEKYELEQLKAESIVDEVWKEMKKGK